MSNLNKIENKHNLNHRSGLPNSLRHLLKIYPREEWSKDILDGNWVSFWLSRHKIFRKIGDSINDSIERTLDSKLPGDEFVTHYSHLMNLMLNNLHSHHTVEDNFIFPKFYNKINKFRYGLDLLENDHELIHNNIEELVIHGNHLIKNLSHNLNKDFKSQLEKYRKINKKFDLLLKNHLNDEEDLIIPFIILHGEDYFGLGH